MKPKKVKQKIKGLYYRSLCHLLHPKKKGLNPYEDAPLKYWLTKRVPGNHRSALCLLIRGKTIKSGYTGWLKRKGKNYGVQTWFRRKEEDLLEAILLGTPEDLEMVLNYAQKGNRRSVIENVEEYWFNKEIKQYHQSREEENEEESDTEESSIDHKMWKETVELYKDNIQRLGELMHTPNQYATQDKFSVAGELNREAKIFGVFVMRHSFSNYIAGNKGPLGLQSTLNSKVSSSLRAVTDHKHITKQILDEAGLPVPRGEVFTDFNKAADYVQHLNRPVVVKPIEGSFGFGITVGVSTREELEVAWNYALKRHHEIIIEELVNGVDLRIIVVGGKAQAALLRVPANIQGDGETTIEELIHTKNKARSSNPRFNKTPLRVDDYTEAFLMKQGYEFDSVPGPGETVFLHLKANIGAGADGVEITDFIHPDIMKLAEEASQALGVPDFWGIDILAEAIDRPRDGQHCCIIEVNSRASFGGLHYPVFGKSKNIARKIIEHNCEPLEINDRVESIEALVYGCLTDEIMAGIERLGERFGLQGFIEQRLYGGKVVARGKKEDLQFFLSYLMDRKMEDDGYIEGLQVLWNEEKRNVDPHSMRRERSEKVYNFIDGLECDTPGETEAREEMDFETELLAREAEKRGYQLKRYSEDLIELNKHRKTGYLSSRFSTIFADEICEKRVLMKKALALKGLPVAKGIQLKGNEQEKAVSYFQEKETTFVLSAYSLKEKKVKHCTSEKALKKFWKKTRNKGANTYLMEERINGWNIHIPVIKRKAKGGFISIPWEIKGDGNSTIKELIFQTNEKLKAHPLHRENIIEIDESLMEHLVHHGYQLDDRLENNSRLLLRDEGKQKGIMGYGNIGEILHQDFYTLAEEALAAIPGLNFGVVEIVVPDPEKKPEEQYWAITNIDTKPSIALFAYPWKGKALLLGGDLLEEVAFEGDIQWIKRRDDHEC